MVPGSRHPRVRSTPSISLTTAILPVSTAKSARSPPSDTANSPASRWTSAELRARRSSSVGARLENSGTARTSSVVSTTRSCSALERTLQPARILLDLVGARRERLAHRFVEALPRVQRAQPMREPDQPPHHHLELLL